MRQTFDSDAYSRRERINFFNLIHLRVTGRLQFTPIFNGLQQTFVHLKVCDIHFGGERGQNSMTGTTVSDARAESRQLRYIFPAWENNRSAIVSTVMLQAHRWEF
jgi:hypothetical protein